ncbi:oxidoreductase domain protein [Plakobranchus ocellatus]|uniref:Oxidoreductase domain protein n=1 Tax=Plakobranchus ocellatus TaxID=259542 RepID=A0AAV3YQJ7_9GAST|nr:oxidoreductase domain protein [Plakobranchus ocellatus]
MAPLTCLIVGAGNRGSKYSVYATLFPGEMKVIGVADPIQARQKKLCERVRTIEKHNIFADWHEAAEREKFADFVIITTPDQQHREPAVAFARQGYDILLEKPMAVSV